VTAQNSLEQPDDCCENSRMTGSDSGQQLLTVNERSAACTHGAAA